MIWPIIFFSKILNHLGRFSAAWAMFCGFLAWILGVIDALVTVVMDQLTALFNSFSTSGLGNVNFATVENIGLVNALFPLSEFITMCGIYVTAWVTVIIIRWVKSFVPTMAN